MLSRSKPPRVALAVETSTQFGRTLLAGIAQYVRENGPWSVMFTDRAVNDEPPSWLRNWSGDGIVTRIPSPAIRSILEGVQIPVVDLNEQTADMGIPQISNDHEAVARMAVEHLLDRGYREFGFVGHPGHFWSDLRQRTFSKLTKDKGFPCSVYSGPPLGVHDLREGAWNTEFDQLVQWLTSLPRPIGLMASTDFRGLQLLAACRVAGIAVPEDAAVVGVGNDDLACMLSDPPLSSVVLDAWNMGYRSAALLDRMMRGEKVKPGYAERIPPVEVALRRSTDSIAVYDPLVRSACAFIRENALKGIQVTDVLQHLGVSRTTLQDRFRRELQKTIHDLIMEIRLGRVRELLTETDIPLAEIALRCGFQHIEYMSEVMRKYTHLAPGAYRRKFSVGEPKRHEARLVEKLI